MEPTGKINVYVNGGSTGNSIETTVVQLTADALGADIEDVSTIQGDTAVTPYGAGTQGSRSGPMTAGAVNEAGTILRDRLAALAASMLSVEPSEIELANSKAVVRGDDTKSVTFADLAYRAHYEPGMVPPGTSATLEATARFVSPPTAMIHWANATHACTCEVDVVTGQVTLTRYIVSEDVGPMINPNIVEGQIAGGTVQGIGARCWRIRPTTTTATRCRRRSWTICCRLPPTCRRSSTATSRSPAPASAVTRAAARAARSDRHPRSSTPSTTRWLRWASRSPPARHPGHDRRGDRSGSEQREQRTVRVELVNEFRVPVPIDKAWDVLTDVQRVARAFRGRACCPSTATTSPGR